jgi:Cd(II)/Pb(II)-responsive transcriptional regulator
VIKIGELSKRTGCSIQTIRYYEKELLLTATGRSEGNYRLYDDNSISQLLFVKQCRSLGISLKEIKRLISLKNSPDSACEDVSEIVDEHIKQVEIKMKELKSLHANLKSLRTQCLNPHTVQKCGILKQLTLTNTNS